MDAKARALAQFLEKVNQDGPWSEECQSQCWVWGGSLQKRTGYGVHYFEGRSQMAHRVSYMLHVGLIPKSLEIDHLCFRAWCVCPSHLEPVTTEENIARSRRRQKKRTQELLDWLKDQGVVAPPAVHRGGPKAKSGYIGVRDTDWGTYRVTVWHPQLKKRIHIGTWYDPEEAARAYDEAIVQLRGEGAKTNFPRAQQAEGGKGLSTPA